MSLTGLRHITPYLGKKHKLSELPRKHEEHVGNAQGNQAASVKFRGP